MWGLFLSTFHINVGEFQILPAFVGWLMIARAVEEIMKEYSLHAYKKAHLYASLVAIETILSFVLNLLVRNNEYIQVLTLIYMIFNLLFIYYFMGGSIEYLRIHGKHSEAEHYKGIQLFFIIFCVIIDLIGGLSLVTGSGEWNSVAGGMGLILVISLMITIKNIKNIEVDQQVIEGEEA
jgi:hypothetical protein